MSGSTIIVLAFVVQAHWRRTYVVTLLSVLSTCCCLNLLHWLVLVIRMKILVQTLVNFFFLVQTVSDRTWQQ